MLSCLFRQGNEWCFYISLVKAFFWKEECLVFLLASSKVSMANNMVNNKYTTNNMANNKYKMHK